MRTDKNIRKIAAGEGDDYTSGCLLDYTYFKKYYKMIAIDLSKRQGLMLLIAIPIKSNTANQFYWKFRSRRKYNIFFIIEEMKETILGFSQGTVRVF